MMHTHKWHTLLLLSTLLAFMLLSGCAAQRMAGWEQDVVAAEGDAAAFIAQGNELWLERADVGQLERALGAFEEAATIDTENLGLLITLARGNYFWADAYLVDDKERQTAVYEKSLSFAEKAMALHPEFKALVESGATIEDAVKVLDVEYVGAVYWGSASLGKWGLNKGLATILKNKERGRKMMARCVELDETYYYGGPHRWFGSYYGKLPAIAGRDLNRSKEHFDKAIAIAPNYFGTRVLQAEYYSKNAQDKELFQSDLEFVINTPSDVIPELVPEHDVEKKKAQDMLDAIEDTFL